MNPYADIVEMSPFVATQQGEHGAFLCRVQPELVKLACERIRARRLGEVRFNVSEPKRRLRIAA